ncbi:MAG: hypothetical protein H0Z28_08000 [Archaeoglobus sp.]|nr:hypothetical protein [Archaeoglobus sp.]
MVKPKWIRKIRKFGNEKVIQIPHEIADSLDSEFMEITVEDEKIVLTPVN